MPNRPTRQPKPLTAALVGAERLGGGLAEGAAQAILHRAGQAEGCRMRRSRAAAGQVRSGAANTRARSSGMLAKKPHARLSGSPQGYDAALLTVHLRSDMGRSTVAGLPAGRAAKGHRTLQQRCVTAALWLLRRAGSQGQGTLGQHGQSRHGSRQPSKKQAASAAHKVAGCMALCRRAHLAPPLLAVQQVRLNGAKVYLVACIILQQKGVLAG